MIDAKSITEGSVELPAASIDLLVMAYVRLYPEDIVYVPEKAQIQFRVTVTKQGHEIGVFSILFHSFKEQKLRN